MEKYNAKINYLYNSGFAIETEKHFLIFDYYNDKVDKGNKGISNGAISTDDLKLQKDILSFASHSHGDHYNPLIFDFKSKRPDTKYILSSDISDVTIEEGIYLMSAYDERKIGNVSVKAFGSTDIGISFLVNVDGINIFHAGDLNWWHWYDEADTSNRLAEKAFKQELEKIKGSKVDIAFFPVDLRLKEYYYLGAQYFTELIKPKVLIPMHFREDFNATTMFKSMFGNGPTRVIEITHRGQEILI